MTEEAKDCRTKRIQGDGSRVSRERKESVRERMRRERSTRRQDRGMREGHRRMEYRDISNSSPEKEGDTVLRIAVRSCPQWLQHWWTAIKELITQHTCQIPSTFFSPEPETQLHSKYWTNSEIAIIMVFYKVPIANFQFVSPKCHRNRLLDIKLTRVWHTGLRSDEVSTVFQFCQVFSNLPQK